MNNYSYDSSDDETELDDYKGKNGLVFFIDFREDMFELDSQSSNTYFRLCLNTCKNVMKEIARSGKDDLLGITLMGTERGTSDGSSLLANIQPLGSVSAERIKQLDEIIVDNGDSLRDKYGRIDKKTNLNLVKVVTSSLKMFTDCKSKVYTKTLVILTNDDDPLRNDAKMAHLARKHAKKLSYSAIDLIVVGLGDDFQSNKFYNELIALVRNEIDRNWARIDRVKKITDADNFLLTLMSRLSRTYRDLFLAEDIAISVSLFKLYKEPKVKFKGQVIARLEDENLSPQNQPNSSLPKFKNDVSFSQKDDKSGKATVREMVPLIGGKLINITKEELESASFDIEFGLTLVGFMPTENIPEYLSVKPPRVMLPNYFSQDSLKAFSCTLQYCREEQLSMVCWYKYNQRSQASLVVCHPMPQQSNSKGNVCPDGFCIVTIPYAENYSDPEVYRVDANPSDNQIEAACAIVKKLSIAYSVDIFHDYDLQRTLAMIEALALDYDQMEDIIDDTILDDSSTDQRIADYVADLNDCSHLGPCDTIVLKRPDPSRSDRPAKNPKLSSIGEIIETIRNGNTDGLTVPMLREALTTHGIGFSFTAKKEELMNLVNANIKL